MHLDLTQWMEQNSSEARRIVDMIRDVFRTSPHSIIILCVASYKNKLYLFYLVNSVLVQERSTGIYSVQSISHPFTI